MKRYEDKFKEISSITEFTQQLTADGNKRIWQWKDKEFCLGKNSTEADFHKRLFVEWFIDEKMSKK